MCIINQYLILKINLSKKSISKDHAILRIQVCHIFLIYLLITIIRKLVYLVLVLV